jgi:hypothetical protein
MRRAVGKSIGIVGHIQVGEKGGFIEVKGVGHSLLTVSPPPAILLAVLLVARLAVALAVL